MQLLNDTAIASKELRNAQIDRLIQAFNTTRTGSIEISIGGFRPLISLGQTLNVESLQYKIQEEGPRGDLEQDILLVQDQDEQWTV